MDGCGGYDRRDMTGIIIQARLGSTRLPGKVLMKIGNKTLLEHIIYRLSFLKNKKIKIVVATSEREKDSRIAAFCRKKGVSCFRGSEENVLERYYLCAQKYGFEEIVRLTADNPFVDVEEIERLIEYRREQGADYAKSYDGLPYGVGAEVFTFKALEKDYKESSQPHHFEHVNEYMLENPQLFKTVDLPIPQEKRRPDIRLTVDTEEDYKRACYIVTHCKNEYVSTQEAIEICSQFV